MQRLSPQMSILQAYLALAICGACATFVYLATFTDKNENKNKSKKSPPKSKPGPHRRYSDHLQEAYEDALAGQPHLNPFINETRFLSINERIKMSVMTVTIFPIRVLASIGFFIFILLWSKLCAIGLEKEDGLTRPLWPWRQFLMWPVRLAFRGILFAWGYYYIEVKGTPASAKEAPILVPNHISFVEPVFFLYRCLPMSVGNHSMLLFPGTESLHQLLQNIPLMKYLTPNTATNMYSREWVKQQIISRAQDRSGRHSWPQLLIFPEGTTHNKQALVHFKNGPFLPGQPVQPIVVSYDTTEFDPCWVAGGPDVAHLFHRLLCQPVNRMSVEFLPVYTPSEHERAGDYMSAKLYASNVREVMADALGCATTEHSYEDVKLVDIARMLMVRGGILDAPLAITCTTHHHMHHSPSHAPLTMHSPPVALAGPCGRLLSRYWRWPRYEAAGGGYITSHDRETLESIRGNG
jgi:lysophosphatidylcholine acyltransferase/lyso-PAF acetyltransferase